MKSNKKSKNFSLAIRIFVVVMLAMGTSVLAQDPTPKHFSGVINDYTPATIGGKVVGPWEIRGPWSLNLKGDSGKADFSAALTMELSDFTRSAANVDSTSGATSRMQHTHHITIEDGTVTPIPTGGFEVSGPATITKDGSPAPLATTTLNVDITGGTIVEYSNITLTFEVVTGGATGHFGTQAIHGVVRKATNDRKEDGHH
jgi:hypothetical protein